MELNKPDANKFKENRKKRLLENKMYEHLVRESTRITGKTLSRRFTI